MELETIRKHQIKSNISLFHFLLCLLHFCNFQTILILFVKNAAKPAVATQAAQVLLLPMSSDRRRCFIVAGGRWQTVRVDRDCKGTPLENWSKYFEVLMYLPQLCSRSKVMIISTHDYYYFLLLHIFVYRFFLTGFQKSYTRSWIRIGLDMVACFWWPLLQLLSK
jgi:hypothetical protein